MNLNKAATKTRKSLKMTKGIEDPSHCHENCISLWHSVTNCYNCITNVVVGSVWIEWPKINFYKNTVHKKIGFKAVWLIHSSTIKVQWNIFTEINLLHSTVTCTANLSLYIGLLNMDMYCAQIRWYFAFTVNKEYAHSIQFVCPYHDNTL